MRGTRSRHGNIFKLKGHHIERASDVHQPLVIVVGPDMHTVTVVGRWTIGDVGDGLDAVAHAFGRHGKHGSELPAAKYP